MEDATGIVRQLVILQKIDSGIQAIENEKADAAAEIKAMQEKMQVERAEFEAKKKKLDETRKIKAGLEMDIKSKEGDIKKKDDQTALIKTNEAYKALQGEINAIRKEIKTLEEKELVVMEEEDSIHKWIKQQEAAIKSAEAAANVRTKTVETEIVEKTKAAAAEKVKRDEHVKGINKSWYEKYEKIRKNKGGMALAPVKLDEKNNGICGGCQMTVRAQKVIEIKKQEDIFICENCARIFFIEEKQDA